MRVSLGALLPRRREDADRSLSSYGEAARLDLHSFPTRRSSDLVAELGRLDGDAQARHRLLLAHVLVERARAERSEEHTSELQSHSDLVCRLLLEKKNH